MRITRKEMEETFRKMEKKHELSTGLISEIYRAESDVVFMGKRRNILTKIRSILVNSKKKQSGGD